MKPNLEINLFGPFEAASNGRILTGFDSDKVRALLAYLIVEAGSPQQREKLAGLFWPNFSERSARTNLRRALSNLRKVIGDREADPPFLFVTRQTVQFNRASSAVVDVLNFQELIQQNTSQASDSTHLEEALQLYRGDFLVGFSIPDSAAFETWQVTQREQYQGEAWGTLQRLVDLYIERDQRERATACARRLVAFDPFQESAQRQFMRLLAEGGRRNEALAQFEALNQLLSDELNVEPDPETTALYERIRSGELDREGRTAARDRVRGYELHELLGRGQFGAVYRATQTGVDRDVAIKVIAAQYADNPDFIRRFEVEAQFVARLEHPAIVPLYDYWREPGGAYLVMRWLRGGNLQTALADGRWDLLSAVRLVDQIAGALFTAHRQGIVHRDIKPANILLDEDQNAYLSDFGIAKDIYFDRGTIQEGRLVGSPGYLAPERIAQETVTPLTDIYSLGIMIYELLTGSHPFHDSEAGALIGRHLNDPLPTITDQRPDLPVAINEVIQRATAKDPAGRYPDAPSLAAAFSTAARVHETFEVSETAVAANPYKGLRAFRESDTEDFFGREALTVELLDRLRKNDGDGRFLAVVGPSGSGKSSVVRAGVVPALRQGLIAGSEAWFIAQMIPGGRPFEELEASLLRIAVNPPQSLLGQMEEDTRGVIRAVKRVLPGDDETELLLIVDQFEELFTLVEDGQQRQFFLDSLLEAVSDPRGRVRLILTLRADFYDRPLNYAGFGELVRRSTVAIVPLTGDELDMAIAAPAHNAGVFIEPELLATIKHDISHQPGALPLLQYALTELYERRRGKRMTLAAYHEMGGVMAALGRRAEEIYQCLDPAEQEASRQLFLRLVSVGEGAEDTRRRVLRSELQELGAGSRQRFGKAEIEAVIEAFGGHRLLTFDRDPATRAATVEVAHEALLREWERLRGWLEESWSDLIRHRQLRRAAAEWVDSSGEDESFLLRGERLARFERWAEETNLALSSDERAFLGASIVRRNVRQAAEQERQEKEALLEQRAGRRLRYLVLVVATALLVAMGLIVTTIFFAQEQRLTETLAEVSLARALFSESLANLETDPELSALLVLEAANRFQSLEQDLPPELELHMHQVAQAESVSQTFQTSGPMAMSPDGQLLAVGDAEGRLRLWNPLTGEDAWGVVRYQHRNRPIGAVAFSPDGRLLASASADGFLNFWDVASSEEIGFIESQQGFTSIAFEPDGHQLLAAEGNGSVTLLDLQELPAPDGGAAQPLELSSSRSFAHLPGAALELHYSPDGRQVAMLVPDTGILIYDAQSGEQLLEISGVSDAADTFAYSAAGETIAARSADLEVTVWDANTGDTLLIIPVDELVTNVAFSPDGRYLAIGTADGKATLWDIQSSAAAVFLAGHAGRVTDMVFHPDGRLLATSAADGLTRVWDLDLAGSERFTLAAHEGRAHDVQYNADGTLLASAGDDGLVNLWAAQSGDLLHELPGPFNRVHFPTFSPDGLRLAAANRDEGLAIWDAHTGQELLSLQSEAPVTAIDYNSEGTIIAAGDQEGKITIWDASTGERLLVISTNSPEIVELIFITPAVIYAWDRTGLLMAWNVQTGDLLSELQCINDVHIDADLSEDGQYIAAACNWVFVAEAVEVPEEGDTIYRLASNDSGETVGVSFSPDGSSVAIVGSAGDISLWDTATGQVDLRLYTPQVSELGYMAYGLSYGLGSVGTSFGGIDFSPDGRYLAAAAADGTIRVFVLPFEELMANLRARLSRDFSDAECQKYLNLPECPAE